MDIIEATARYERWLAQSMPLVRDDMDLKHRRMAQDVFSFLRATFYRWAQVWPEVCSDLAAAPVVLGVGDLHVENFGTWRDSEGRLIWGINDFDETVDLPYTNDLVRLCTSALIASEESHLALPPRKICAAVLEGYTECLREGGNPVVLAERHRWLRDLALARLKEHRAYWGRLQSLRPLPIKRVDSTARRLLEAALPERGLAYRMVHRQAGLGSLGRQRLMVLADWRGGYVAREAKRLTISAWIWMDKPRTTAPRYAEMLSRAVRVADPFLCLTESGNAIRTNPRNNSRIRESNIWLVRRLAPDCCRVELASLPVTGAERKLLWMMGWETGNIHLGTPAQRKPILVDLTRRKPGWLSRAAERMHAATFDDWRRWRKANS